MLAAGQPSNCRPTTDRGCKAAIQGAAPHRRIRRRDQGRAVGDESASRNRKFESTPLQRRVCELSVPLCGNPVRVRAPSLHRHYPVSAVLPPSAEARRTCASSSATRSRKAALFSMSPCVRSGSNVCQAAASRGWPASSERRKNAALGNFLLRPAAVPVERDGVPIQPRRLCPFASLDFTEREMPAQMPIEKAVARIAGEPRGWGGVGAASSSPLS
jgi:hypothetical protein